MVINCGNTLAHFLTQEDISAAFQSARECLHKHGVYLNALTDHRAGIDTQDRLRDINIHRAGQSKTVNFQVWTWIEEGKVYKCDDFSIIDHVKNDPELKKVSADFRIWSESELKNISENCGFKEMQWIEPAQSGHHNPFYVCRAV